MRPGLLLRTMVRESRGARGRMLLFAACLALGVGAVTGVSGTIAALEDGLREGARRFLAADLAVRSREPLPDALDTVFADVPGARRADLTELTSMAAAPASDAGPGRSTLVQLKAVGEGWPFYGELVLDPPRPLDQLLRDDTVLVAPELLSSLRLSVGDDLLLNGRPFTIAATIVDEPDRLDIGLTMGPRVLLSQAGLERAGIGEGFGTRVSHKALFRLPGVTSASDLEALGERALAVFPENARARAETWRDAQPRVRESLHRVEDYLGLVALLSLLLGGTGVAQIVRTWLAARTEALAVMRCLGFRPREIGALALGHVALLALVASVAGAAAGGLLPLVLPRLAPDLVPPGLARAFQPAAWLRGLGLGVGVALLFALPPLSAIWRVSPARVLRADAEPLPPRRLVLWTARLLLLAGVLGVAWLQSGSLLRAAAFSGGLVVLLLLLAAGARFLMGAGSRLSREGLPPVLAHALSALARPGEGTLGAVVALGLGVLVVGALLLVERRLEDFLAGALPDDAPSVFLVDIQPDQWPGVERVLDDAGATHLDSVPVVTARLSSIDGVDVDELADRHGNGHRGRWALTREQRLTWRASLPDDNHIVAGALWNDPDHAEVSLEQDYAEELGVGLGSRLTFDVQGVPVELHVTSLRTVDWRTFGINFFLVVEPGVLEDAPHMRLAAARLPPDATAGVQDALVASWPNVTLLDVRSVLQKVGDLLDRLAAGVRALGLLAALTGLAVLAGAIGTTTLRRSKEAALLKTLGLTRAKVASLFAAEYALWGVVAGLLGGVGALVLADAFLDLVLEIRPELPWLGLPLAVGVTAVLAVAAGLAASLRALSVRPLQTLRG